ncbi:D-serine deaminase-like pyridoxal phosphate-dependent protein [Erwinia toletana]|uniref:D-serine deaminase-like pyridoxal phosphate-dependent protein n=1 Tax=Winslowiella toletana TaxID=92490 RepID=A0ABS4PC95_9GAMM|nr:amino acid deaminase [Winslowiella toletana]MBP2169792.1 D-serine deaminase-like pyridoxal phosphate-dependent protein [Winslowiella toletana]
MQVTSIRQKGLPVSGKQLLQDVSLPALVLHQSAVQHNLGWMQQYATAHGAELAPHGKTTMAPALFQRQMDAGAWGITLATATQCAVAAQHGIRRMLLANQLLGQANMQIVADLLRPGDIEFHCLVDSAVNVHQLGAFFHQQGLTLNVMLEVGVVNGRCGCRTQQQINEVTAAIAQYDSLALSGIEGYEGVIFSDSEQQDVAAFISMLVKTALALKTAGKFASEHPIITASGSTWYDLVAEAFAREDARDAFITLMRPGCYLVHDHGIYKQAQNALLARHPEMHSALLPAMEVFAYVQSTPEAGRVIAALGKRDIAHDSMPVPLRVYQQGQSEARSLDASYQVVRLMDQHAFLQVPADHQLTPGDIIAFGASHPCLTFDKWRQLCVVDDNLQVVETLPTFF